MLASLRGQRTTGVNFKLFMKVLFCFQWKYDELTALYFLLCKKKSKGQLQELLPRYSK